jgi:hypothetical protein
MVLCLYQRSTEEFSVRYYFPPIVIEMSLEVRVVSLVSISDSPENDLGYIRVLLLV